MRQCIICRRTAPRWELVQLTAAGAPHRSIGGRRAYVCIDLTCLLALAQRGWARASDEGTARLSPQQLQVQLAQMAAARLRETLGLARRQGLVVLGAGRLLQAAADACGVVMSAADAADNTLEQLARAGLCAVSLPFLHQGALGLAVGSLPLAAVGMQRSRLASQAAYWLRVWYEAQAEPVPQALQKLSGQALHSTGRIEVAR